VHLTLIGDGDQLELLRFRLRSLNLEREVRIEPPVCYGAELFRRLDEFDVAVTAPMVEDTPRAAFDTMARGLPIVAFDITYFGDLSQESGAVALAGWPDAAALAEQFQRLANDRYALVAMVERAVDFARENTQDHWLELRLRWVRQHALAVAPRGWRSASA
jgi:glycosyltransferase involved in cell wall biosynthesis